MKKLLTLALALVVLAAFAGLGAAQQKGVEKSPPTGVEMKQPETQPKVKLAMKGDFTRLTFKMTGKVTQVNGQAKTFTVETKNGLVTVSAAKLPALPKIGEIVDITYTETTGGMKKATTINTSKSNTY